MISFWLENNRWMMVALNGEGKLPEFEVKISDTHKTVGKARAEGQAIRQRAAVLFAPHAPSEDPPSESLAADMAHIGTALNERGEKLNELEQRTAQVAQASHNFASQAKQLAEMQKNRKWYQL